MTVVTASVVSLGANANSTRSRGGDLVPPGGLKYGLYRGHVASRAGSGGPGGPGRTGGYRVTVALVPGRFLLRTAVGSAMTMVLQELESREIWKLSRWLGGCLW